MRNRKAQAHGALWKKYGYDIKISVHGMDRMKTAQLFRKKVSAKILIFVSSSREYVFEAYDVEAFQYLLKPVEDRKLKNVSLCRGGAGGIFLRGLLSRLIHAGRLSA